jgi:hypothetical protein
MPLIRLREALEPRPWSRTVQPGFEARRRQHFVRRSGASAKARARRKAARNCRPWVRSFTHAPEALTNSPAAARAAWPTTVARSRRPRTFTRSTQKPVSALWKVTRSTRPDRTSVRGATAALLVPSMLPTADP